MPRSRANPVPLRRAGAVRRRAGRRHRHGRATPEYRVEALAKGLRILALFDEQRPSWRVSDLATAAGLPMPTVYRVVHDAHLRGLPRPPAQRRLPPGRARPHARHRRAAQPRPGRHRHPQAAGAGPAHPARRSTSPCSPATACSTWSGCATPTWSRRTSRSARPCRRCTRRSASCCWPTWTTPTCETRITEASFAAQPRPQRQALAGRAARRAGRHPRAGLGHAGRGAGLRAALGGRADHRRRTGAWWPGSTSPCRPATGRRSASSASSSRSCWPPAPRSPALLSARHARDGREPRRAAPAEARTGRSSTPTSARSTTPSPAAAGPPGRSCSGWSTTDGRLEGPFNAFLLQPALGSAAAGARCRPCATRPQLADRAREIAILVVATHWDSRLRVVRPRGGRPHRSASTTPSSPPCARAATTRWTSAEQLVARRPRRWSPTGTSTTTTYGEAVGRLGRAAMFELLTLVGYYAHARPAAAGVPGPVARGLTPRAAAARPIRSRKLTFTE